DQHLLDEILGTRFREGEVEMKDEEFVHSQGLDGARLDPEWRQPEWWYIGAKDRTGMGLEGQNRRAHAQLGSSFLGERDDRLMAEMDAIEIAQRYHRAPGIVRHLVEMPEDPHGPPSSKPSRRSCLPAGAIRRPPALAGGSAPSRSLPLRPPPHRRPGIRCRP